MTEYMVLIPGDEAAWAAASAEERSTMYQRHAEFARLLAERGHKVTHGAELADSSTARTVRAVDGTVTITEGPYAETAEQLTGFYLVDSDDLDDLLEVVSFLAQGESTLEVRACLGGSEDGA